MWVKKDHLMTSEVASTGNVESTERHYKHLILYGYKMSFDSDTSWICGGERGTYLEIMVSPGASSSHIGVVDEWRGCLEVYMEQRAQQGKANRALIRFFSHLLGVSQDRVIISRGARSRNKTLFIEGLEPDIVIRCIKEAKEG